MQYKFIFNIMKCRLSNRAATDLDLKLELKMNISIISLEQALEILGQLLKDRGQYYEVVAIGGGGLLLLGLIDRTTKDLDLVARLENNTIFSSFPLPKLLLDAAQEVGRALQLGEGWLNCGPASLLDAGLPEGFLDRMHTRHYKGLTLHLASRIDQICFKLYASVDHELYSKHYVDLISLKPSSSELEYAKKWCLTQDVSETFALLLDQTLESLREHS